MLKKLKNFCRLTRHSEGFTLVELVVVIAIVAILSGIAVPAYGAYVEKSQKAGDLQLLAAVNKAFAAAVFENGDAIEDVDSAELLSSKDEASAVSVFAMARTASKQDDSYSIRGIKKAVVKGVDKTAAYHDAFRKYYVDNENSEFKAIKRLYFSEKGVFEEDEEMPFRYGDGEIVIYKSQVEKINLSAFMTADGLGVSSLLDKIDSVVDFGLGMLIDGEGNPTNFGNLILGEEYQQYMATALGVDPTDTDALEAAIGALAEKSIAGMTFDSDEDREAALQAATMKIMTNNAVLYAAKNSTTSKEDMLTILRADNPKKAITDAMGKQDPSGNITGTGLSQASAAYGMYTAFIYSQDDNYTYDGKTKAQLIQETSDPLAILNGLGNKDFQNYMDTPQAEKDLEGYLAAMDMINSSSNDPDAVSNVLINGFNDPALKDLITQATKK